MSPKLLACAALLVLAAACGQNDNLIVGAVASGATTPDVIFDNIGSSIHGVATLRDASGNPVGSQMGVIIMSDKPGLCDILHAHHDYFRNAPEPYETLIMMVPLGYLGTFIIGRQGTDATTAAEIVAASGAQPTTPFHALNNSYIALTNWADNGGKFMVVFG